MKNPRRIDFTFIFDGADGLWPSLAIFESDITDFLKQHNVEATMVKKIEGQIGEYTLFLSKVSQIANMPQPQETPKVVSTPPGKQVDNVRKQIGRK